MLPVPQEYVGSMTEIKSLSNDLLAVGKMIKIDHDALEFAAMDSERMILLKYRLPVKIFIHNSRLNDQVLVGTVYLSTDNFLRLEEVRSLQDFERRGAFRVNTGVPGRLSRIMSEREQEEFNSRLELVPPEQAEAMLASTYTDVRVMDVSLTGVRLNSPRPLQVGQRYVIEFAPLDRDMTFCLRVERTITMENQPDQFGCCFYDVSERQLDQLCRDLFQLQRIEKSRRRNNPL